MWAVAARGAREARQGDMGEVYLARDTKLGRNVPLSSAETINVAQQLAEGLREAHLSGVFDRLGVVEAQS